MRYSSIEASPCRAPLRLRRIIFRSCVALLAATLLAGGYWAFWHHHTKRFQVVREGVFYRVAQPSEFGLRYLVNDVGIRTVLSVQLYDFRLRRGLVSFGPPDGCRESEYLEQLGARSVQWPMGVEKSWPWLTPWQFEQFFQLLDDPNNWPVAAHCQGGRHRTGTLAALFRLEYDRWDADRTLKEMYDFNFGGAIRLQEENLRTYLPRPHPDEGEWAALEEYWSPFFPGSKMVDYEELVRRLRTALPDRPDIERAAARYLGDRQPFALALVQRLIKTPDDPLVKPAAQAAAACLETLDAKRAAWSMSAALVADFGSPHEQQRLVTLLGDVDYQQASADRFDAVVEGVANRYTPNRIAFLRPLLDNEHHHRRQGATPCRYCDTAVARLSAIVDENFPDMAPPCAVDPWENGRLAARKWCDAHPGECQLSQLKPASGQTMVEPGDPPQREDLSRARF
ncbi:MAG TPA: tyrosine-protein phosphatase [Pirellulales bacterium]|nr:tyrosine-protein phosphatase [Pirellulales bacterium]